ncbi:unnamed protein product [Miscanthus lutarioriparius]|uniref:Uncharacterized protein n=1 Tax=Miscanthus lutarioriparius TaxID=422564 RepID=A0A811QVW6_9POAL|nr:unnamed protein product [Miscanthus lutarioriparius]
MALFKTGSSRRDNSSLRRFTKDCDILQRIDATSGLLATEEIFLRWFSATVLCTQ